MKIALLTALILTETALIGSECAPPEIARGRTRSERLPVIGERVGVVQTVRVTRRGRPAPVAERIVNRRGPTSASSYSIEGVALRVLTAPNPVQMINPLAPSEYGSSRDLVTYTRRDIYRTSNENKSGLQTSGIRLLTLRPLW